MDAPFDYAIFGTGLKNAILSAGLAQRKMSIYHVDSNVNYGSYWISLSFEEILQIENAPQKYTNECFSNFEFINNLNTNDTKEENENNELNNEVANNILAQQKCVQQPSTLTVADMIRLSNKFKFDFLPKIFQNNSKTIKLIVQSQIHHYLEFMVHGKNYMGTIENNDALLRIPFTRGDVFKNDRMNLLEKRCFVRFIAKCLQLYSSININNNNNNNNNEDDVSTASSNFTDNKELIDFFNNEKLPNNLVNVLSHDYILNDCLSMNEVLNEAKDFIERLGNLTEAIYTFTTKSTHMSLRYGISELSQAFCRISAVFGTIFRLNVTDSCSISYSQDTDVNFTIKINDDIIRAKNIIIEPQYLKYLKYDVGSVHNDSHLFSKAIPAKKLMRAILVTTKSLFSNSSNENINTNALEDEASSILTILEKKIDEANNQVNTIALELGTKLMVTPMNLKLVHLFKWSDETSAKDSFQHLLNTYFSMNDSTELRPKILYAVFFIQNVFSDDDDYDNQLSLPWICTSYPQPSLNIDNDLIEITSIMERIDPQTPLLLPRNVSDD